MSNESDISENDDFRAKVEAIFRELVGDRVFRLGASQINFDTKTALHQALSPCPEDRSSPEDCIARDIVFHLSDWGADAAFIVALQHFPERFTAAEIEHGVDCFLVHVPNHVAAAAVLAGNPVEDIFNVGALNGPTDDEDESNVAS